MRLRALWLSWVFLSQGVAWVWRRRVPPAEVRRHPWVRVPLSLDHPYYPARRGDRVELIPKDRYFEEVERILSQLDPPV